MARRLSVLAALILISFLIVAAQAINIQFVRSSALDASPLNPKVAQASIGAPRGEIVAADGTILARSRLVAGAQSIYQRIYPLGTLTAGLVGFDSPSYGTWSLEAEYNSYLVPHAQPPQSLAQLLAPTSATDNVTLTLQPSLERVAQRALAGRDGAAVVLDPRNGDILAMYSNPTYNPVPFTSFNFKTEEAAWKLDTANNAHGFPPLGLVSTQQTFPPGSTFKIVTTSAVVVHKPQLLNKYYPNETTITLPNTTKTLSNYAFTNCGGTIAEMLPPSCDTGYALVGLDIGGTDLAATANSFGYNEVPPIDLPGVVMSYFPSGSSFTYNQPQLAYSAIGQENVRTSALMNALVAGAVGHGGIMMTPHLLNYVTGSDGSIVKRFKPTVWKVPLKPSQAAQIVPLMVKVVTNGTASGVGFPPVDNVAAKTGTSQVGNGVQNTDDWMIAFAPASDPTIAVAVVMPFQITAATGATVAGPIMKCLVEGALALQSGKKPSGTSTTCAR